MAKLYRKVAKIDFPKTEKTLIVRINDYFRICEDNDKPLTMSGLAVYLGTNRRRLLEMRHRNKKLAEIIERAKAAIEAYLEEMFFNKQMKYSQNGLMFILKNNFGWQEVNTQIVEDKNTKVVVSLNLGDDKKDTSPPHTDDLPFEQ